MARRAFQDDFNFSLVDDGRYRAPVVWATLPALNLVVGETLEFRYSDYASNADLYYVNRVEGDGTLTHTRVTADPEIIEFILSGISTKHGTSADTVLRITFRPYILFGGHRVRIGGPLFVAPGQLS